QVWTSDNTEASDRLFIQYGYSRAYAPRTMVCWVTDVPNRQTGRTSPLDFRFHVAMQGGAGHWRGYPCMVRGGAGPGASARGTVQAPPADHPARDAVLA
ncbi:MAG: hypothetical protein C4289_09480, partial [Chloroflexota bacterium]